MTAVLPRFEPPASRRSSERSGDNGGGEPVRSAPAGTRWTGDVPSRDETDAVPLLTDCSRGVVAVEETTGVDDPHPMRATDWGRDATTSVNSSLQKPKGPKRLKIEPDRTRSKFDRPVRDRGSLVTALIYIGHRGEILEVGNTVT